MGCNTPGSLKISSSLVEILRPYWVFFLVCHQSFCIHTCQVFPPTLHNHGPEKCCTASKTLQCTMQKHTTVSSQCTWLYWFTLLLAHGVHAAGEGASTPCFGQHCCTIKYYALCLVHCYAALPHVICLLCALLVQ